VVKLPLPQTQFAQGEQQKFTKAMADTAYVLESKVQIVTVEIASARRNEINAIMVTSQISVDSEKSADQVQSRMTTADLNANLERQGLPRGNISSVAVTGKAQISSPSGLSTSTIIGLSIGCFILFMCTVLSVLVAPKIWIKIRRNAIIAKLQNAKPNDTISFATLPLEKWYTPVKVLHASPDKDKFIVEAEKISDTSKQLVAIKIMVAGPKGEFEEKQIKQHHIESHVLDMMYDSRYACKKIGKSEAMRQEEKEWLPNLCWFSMEYLKGRNMQAELDMKQYLDYVECLQMARCVLAALKVMHSSHYIHGAVTPSNIHNLNLGDGKFRYRLVGFGSADTAREIESNTYIIAPSPSQRDEPKMSGSFSSDLKMLGKTMQELTASESASIMEEIASKGYMSADEMHQAVFSSLVALGKEKYSVYLSSRSISEGPVAKILFDEFNHSIINDKYRVSIFWDARRMVHSDDWIDGLETGLLDSLCFFPLSAHLLCGDNSLFRRHLQDEDSDSENILLNSENILLSEMLIANALFKRNKEGADKSDVKRGTGEKGVLRCIYPIGPILVQQPSEGHPVPSNFDIYSAPPPTHRYVIKFLQENASIPSSFVTDPKNLSILSAVEEVRKQNKWEMSNSTTDVGEESLTAEQKKFAESWKPNLNDTAFIDDADAKVA
jgi:serine/threonine protein kinase